MNKHLDKILLLSLWTLCAIVGAAFWFGIRYNFDILSRAHWKVLGALQLDGTAIAGGFYFSWILIAAIFIGVCFLILYHKTSGVSVMPEKPKPIPTINNNYGPAPGPMPAPIAPVAPVPQRPQMPNVPGTLPIAVAPGPKKTAASAAAPRGAAPGQVENIAKILENSGWTLRKPPVVNGVKLDFWAIAPDENLFAGVCVDTSGSIAPAEGGGAQWNDARGAFGSPVWAVAGALEKINEILSNTLDEEIKITVRAAVILSGGVLQAGEDIKNVWDALGVSVFADLNEFNAWAAANKMRAPDELEREDFDAYADYINTLAEFFDGK
ncbi:MAG: hypothetical protein LBO08_00025 [Rickettsiales bacterium]|nr:hypothetical protein [Rickettsiales bacterium]